MTVIGKKKATFKDRDTGREVPYGKLYVTFEDEHAEGLVCEAITVKPEMLDNIKIGEDVELSYNRYGKVQEVYKAS